MFCPVTNDEALGAASQTTAPASSEGSPKRAMGVCSMICRPRAVGVPSGLKRSARFWSAGKKPGLMEFTRTPRAHWARQKHREIHDRRLGRRVGDDARKGNDSRERGDVDDASAALRPALSLRTPARGAALPGQVQVEHLAPCGQWQLAEIAAGRKRRLGTIASGGIDEDACRSEPAGDRALGPRQRIAIESISRMKRGRSAGGFDFTDALGAALGVAADDGDLGAEACQGGGHGTAQRPRAADHNGRLAVEVEQVCIHVSI